MNLTHDGASRHPGHLGYAVARRLGGRKAREATAKRLGLPAAGAVCYPSGQVIGRACNLHTNRTMSILPAIPGSCPSGEDTLLTLNDDARPSFSLSRAPTTGKGRP